MNIEAGRQALHQIHINTEGPNLGLWYINLTGKFIHFPSGMLLNDAACDNYLRERGYNFKKENKSISDGQAKKMEIRRDYRPDGIVQSSCWLSTGINRLDDGRTILVLKTLSKICPDPGQCPRITELLHEAFGDERERHLFMGWLSLAIRGFYDDKQFRKPGQILVLVGDSGCDAIQAIIAGVLGEKKVNPFQYSLEKGQLPLELFEACSWAIDGGSIFRGNQMERSRFSHFIVYCLRDETEYKSKFSGSFRLPLFVRGNVAFEWHVRCVRPLADYIFEPHEELIVLRCGLSGLPQEESYVGKIKEELPAFIWYLLNEYQIPGELVAPRFGIAGYFAKDVKNLCFVGTVEYEICIALQKIAPDKKELEEADMPGELEFAGMTRTQMARIVREKPFSVIMECLAEKFPDCFTLKTAKNRRIWKLNFKHFDAETPF